MFASQKSVTGKYFSSYDHSLVQAEGSSAYEVGDEAGKSPRQRYVLHDEPFFLYGGDVTSNELIVSEVVEAATSTGQLSYNDLRSHRLFALHEAIERLAQLPDYNELKIDADTKRTASVFLNLIADRDVALPKLFPHDGEALVFTWDMGPTKRYITVAGDELTGQDISRTTFMRCDYDLQMEPSEARPMWLEHLGTGPLPTSVPADDGI